MIYVIIFVNPLVFSSVSCRRLETRGFFADMRERIRLKGDEKNALAFGLKRKCVLSETLWRLD